MVHFEDKGMFPKVHWRIQEGSQPEYLALYNESVKVLRFVYK